MMNAPFTICEVGSNYDGKIEIATEFVRSARAAGASAVKFQTLSRQALVAPRVLSGDRWVDNPVFTAFSNLELPAEWHHELKRVADECGIEFFSTPFSLPAVELLERVGVSTYKVASGDITFHPLLKAIGGTRKRVIMSTGASDLGDVERALNVLCGAGANDITLLHCVSNYPPVFPEMNLRAMVTLRHAFGLPVGISDHTPGGVVPIAATALGASVIEKHVTFDRSRQGPDHPFAMTMDEFARMIADVGLAHQALGDGIKRPTDAERAKQHRMRRGRYDPRTYLPSEAPDSIWLRPQHTPALDP